MTRQCLIAVAALACTSLPATAVQAIAPTTRATGLRTHNECPVMPAPRMSALDARGWTFGTRPRLPTAGDVDDGPDHDRLVGAIATFSRSGTLPAADDGPHDKHSDPDGGHHCPVGPAPPPEPAVRMQLPGLLALRLRRGR